MTFFLVGIRGLQSDIADNCKLNTTPHPVTPLPVIPAQAHYCPRKFIPGKKKLRVIWNLG